MIGEYFSPKNLGYYQDLVVKSANIEKKKEVSYNLNNGGIIDLDTWTIEASDRKYKLNNYEVFILNVSLDKQGTWKIDKINRMTKEKPDFKAGDRIAMNEIEGTAIVYRGYTE